MLLEWRDASKKSQSIFELNEEPMKGNDMDDQSTPVGKLPQAHEYIPNC